MIEEATSNNGNRTYLQILSQYRLLVSNPQSFSMFSIQNMVSHKLLMYDESFRE